MTTGELAMGYYQRNNFGRYWTSKNLGIQNMSKKIRHTLCKDTMYDIDMKNAASYIIIILLSSKYA